MSKFFDGACPVCAGTSDHSADCVYSQLQRLKEKLAQANRDRDEIWCKAAIGSLSMDNIALLTARFNRIRPDGAMTGRSKADLAVGLCTCGFVEFENPEAHKPSCPARVLFSKAGAT